MQGFLLSSDGDVPRGAALQTTLVPSDFFARVAVDRDLLTAKTQSFPYGP